MMVIVCALPFIAALVAVERALFQHSLHGYALNQMRHAMGDVTNIARHGRLAIRAEFKGYLLALLGCALAALGGFLVARFL